MRGHGPIGLVLLPSALAAVLVADVLWPRVRATGRGVAGLPPLPRLYALIARLPPGVALPLFLVPELCSRGGTVVSAWLLLNGDVWEALALYVAAKLVAGSIALWICSACLPALLRIRMFAAVHASMMASHGSWTAWLQGCAGGRFAAEMRRLRASRLDATIPLRTRP